MITVEVFRDLKIKEEFVKSYKPSEDKKIAAKDDKFLEKDLFNCIDFSKNMVDDFSIIRQR